MEQQPSAAWPGAEALANPNTASRTPSGLRRAVYTVARQMGRVYKAADGVKPWATVKGVWSVMGSRAS